MGATIQSVENYYRRAASNGRNRNSMDIFDKDDDHVQGWDSDEGPIKISKAMKNIEDATVTFNRNLGDVGERGEKGNLNQYSSTFTTNELLNFADSKWKEMRVTVPDGRGGSKTYVITAGPNFDREGFKNYIMGKQNTWNRNAENAYRSRLQKALDRGLSRQSAAMEARYWAGGQMDRILSKGIKSGFATRKGKDPLKFDLRYTTINNSGRTPVNRQGTGSRSNEFLPSNKPIKDTTPQPKKTGTKRKKSTKKK